MLVLACQDPNSDGFEAAFEALYLRHRDRVYSIAYRLVGSASDAMDVVQETFSLVFRKLGSFRFDSLFSTWLYRIVVNCGIDYLRQGRGMRGRLRASIDVAPATGLEIADVQTPTPGDAAATQELAEHVHERIQRLSPKLRAILVLRYLESMSYEELAAVLGISMGTVKSRLARAHIAIESELRDSLPSFGYRPNQTDAADARDARGGVA